MASGGGITARLQNLSVPLFLRLPLIAAVLVMGGSIAALQFSFLAQRPDLEARASGMGKRYVETFAREVEPLSKAKDSEGLRKAIHNALTTGEFDRERAIYFLSADKHLVVAESVAGHRLEPLPPEALRSASGTRMSSDDSFVWAWRPALANDPAAGTLVAALDVGRIVERQQTLMFQMIAICIAVAALAAVFCFFLLRRILDPIERVAKHLALAGQGQLEPITDLRRYDRELLALCQSFNSMVAATRDREMMLLTLAEQDRAAVLGRLVASIVHEVRNPLGGMMASVETIRRFGKDATAREEALSLIQRGLSSIGEVIDASLETYRYPRVRRHLRREDLADVEVLIEAEARQRGLNFERAISLNGEVGVSALEARQILLNLLLNACEATPAGGTVMFAAHVSNDAIEFTVSDNGVGLSKEMVEAIGEGGALPENAGLGLPIVLRLVRRLGGTIRASTLHSGGTMFSLSLPLKQLTEAQ